MGQQVRMMAIIRANRGARHLFDFAGPIVHAAWQARDEAVFRCAEQDLKEKKR
jgi:hypothetical protein